MAVGYTEGYKIGKERGWILGYQKGVRLAAEVAQDVGFYEGYREVSIQLGSASDARHKRQLDKIQAACESVDLNPGNEHLADQMGNLHRVAKQMPTRDTKTQTQKTEHHPLNF